MKHININSSSILAFLRAEAHDNDRRVTNPKEKKKIYVYFFYCFQKCMNLGKRLDA